MRFVSALATLALLFPLQTGAALARNIVISNDDGLTSNVIELYNALKAQGHDVVVSLPCQNQSGMGSAILFSKPLTVLDKNCALDAAKAGDPGVGPATRADLPKDFYYVNGTPVMATMYGIDVAAQARWGADPDLVISGPNEGQNVGPVVMNSGTVNNAQFAAVRGIPAIAISGGMATAGKDERATRDGKIIARYSVQLVDALDKAAKKTGPILPKGLALNVNFPDDPEGAGWQLTRIGTFKRFDPRFVTSLSKSASPAMKEMAKRHGVDLPDAPGLTALLYDGEPTPEQQNDESFVIRHAVAVSPMQAGFDASGPQAQWVQQNLSGLFNAK